MEGFHNPYNFVAALPRDHVPTGTPLGDRTSAHDRYHPSGLSGRLRVELAVRTPLLLLDAAGAVGDAEEHHTLPVRVDTAGSARLAPTAVKGMLRSAYEMVTNSRYGVFTGHSDPLKVDRALSPLSPDKLIPAGIAPARKPGEMSPADRVFGWVADGGAGGAHRGQVRVGQVRCLDTDAVLHFDMPLPLAVLNNPKPEQVRFYLGDLRSSRLVRQDGRRAALAGYDNSPARRLLGRKVYPRQADLEDLSGYWESPWLERLPIAGHHREYRRPGGKTDRLNKSVNGWVRPGARFELDVRVFNLAAVELGALVWLLEQPEPRCLRLGAGRPLGFGSVRVCLRRDESRLHLGSDVRDGYRAMRRPSPASAGVLDRMVRQYKQEVVNRYGAFDQAQFIEEFIAAAKGYKGRVHYPRLTEHPDPKGENFKWFVNNEKGRRRALPEIDGSPLPYKPRV
jgi:hypothetical protein